MKKLFIITLLILFILNSPYSQARDDNSLLPTNGQLAQLLAPIALYPDTLLTHILIASTYPIEIVEAHRWLIKHHQLPSTQIFAQVADKDWDPSVKALLPFPIVLKRLNDELTWTNQLGDVFLADEAQVLSSIQKLRMKAEQAGNLSKMENMAVSNENNNIIIQPLQPEIVYVPYYNSHTIYGNWHWSYYPPIYWAHPKSQVSHRPYYWDSGVHISFNFFFSAFHWQNRHLVVLNHHNSHRYLQKHRIVSSHGAKRWLHKPHHRRGVAYSNNEVKDRYKGNRVSKSQRKINRKKGTQIKATPHKKRRQSHYDSASSTQYSKTLKRFDQMPNNKQTKYINKESIVNQHQANGKKDDKSLNKPVMNNKMRLYQDNKETEKRATRPKINKASRNYKNKAGIHRDKVRDR
jgi:hypothetical protein